jgi:uncharacterized protein YciU (UPF0263 family)
MAGRRVLVIGLDPTKLPQWDPAPVLAELDRGRQRFDELGIIADYCLVDLNDDPGGDVEVALTGNDYGCVVIGGAVRRHEPAEDLFEKIVNMVRMQQPTAAIAFNTRPDDCPDAALRWL